MGRPEENRSDRTFLPLPGNRGRNPQGATHNVHPRQRPKERLTMIAAEEALRTHIHELGDLAYARQTEGRYTESEDLYRRALAAAEAAFAPGALDTAALLNGLG